MPTISNGRLFQFDRVEGSARLRALDARNAKLLWTFEYPTAFQDLYGYDNGPRSSPVLNDGRVYTFGAEGMLHCLDAASGKLVWKIDTAEKFGVIQNFFGVGSTPVVEGELLIVQIGGSPEESKRVPPGRLNLVEGNGSGIVAFDKKTGAVRYEITDELASYSTPKLATIAGRRWCFVFARGGLVGFEPASGKVDFEFPWRAGVLESVNASDPVVKNDLVFISETYGPGSALLRVRPGNAQVVWSDADRRRDKSMQTHWNTAIEVDGYLYGLQRTAHRECRVALCRAGNRPGDVERARPDAHVAVVCRRAFCLPGRGRHVAFVEGESTEVRTGERGRVARRKDSRRHVRLGATKIAQIPGVGGADPVARPVVRARGGSSGVPGIDSRQPAAWRSQ